MTAVVISQPYFFPWVGLWEQMKLADVYVHYDDVQFSKGHYVNRVQIKTAAGLRWMTVPLKANKLGMMINELECDDVKNWRASHTALLESAYEAAAYRDAMLDVVAGVYAMRTTSVAEIVITGLESVAELLGLASSTRFLRSSELEVPGRSSERVLDIVKAVGGDTYVTGHGAKNYLDHGLFERNGVDVLYMDYARTPYPQLHGEFTASVSVLDLIANTGPAAPDYVRPRTVSWRQFVETA